ncbi:DUF2332 domain-containing protein [Terrabacter carboxydivorans]|uniref:DUF2332 domain-containing protein n=1 Tax=Terrabacter carboxydivorans TaxID=619730 RepID=A0ABP5ZH29_9MICO
MLEDVQATYRHFAVYAAGNSPCFEQWALGVADDLAVLRWLARLPEPKRQPNLVFAAARWHGLTAPAPYAELRAALLGDTGRIRRTILERATQTNEVGRLATLVPAFASLPGDGPLGLLEVGASAGLCLYPDRWSYAWGTDDGTRTAGSEARTLYADVSGPAPLPDDVPLVAWRGGIDLNPLDAADPETRRWLLTLVWPEHEDRRARLEEALGIARRERPDLRRGDLLHELPDLAAEALAELPGDGRLLVFHSAVITYLDVPGRERFAALMQDLLTDPRVHWVSNERPRTLPAVTGSGPPPPPGRYVLGVDGRAVGHTHQHGRGLHWWAPSSVG